MKPTRLAIAAVQMKFRPTIGENTAFIVSTIQTLAKQGADPNLGRRLAQIFSRVGLKSLQVGILGGQWNLSQNPAAWKSEWATLETDLASIPDQWKPTQVEQLRQQDLLARQRGERVLFVPTFYAWGIV